MKAHVSGKRIFLGTILTVVLIVCGIIFQPIQIKVGMTLREVEPLLSSNTEKVAFGVDFRGGLPNEEEAQKVEVRSITDFSNCVEIYFNSENQVTRVKRIGCFGISPHRIYHWWCTRRLTMNPNEFRLGRAGEPESHQPYFQYCRSTTRGS
jgi:hypothetical protein